MIKLEIVGETAQEFAQQLKSFASLLAGASDPTVEEAPASPKPRGRTKVAETAAAASQTPAATGSATTAETSPSDPTGAAETVDSGGSSAATGAASTGATPSRDEIANKAIRYGQPNKGGKQALIELLISHGATNGKWSEVPEEALPALNVQLDELLA